MGNKGAFIHFYPKHMIEDSSTQPMGEMIMRMNGKNKDGDGNDGGDGRDGDMMNGYSLSNNGTTHHSLTLSSLPYDPSLTLSPLSHTTSLGKVPLSHLIP